MRGEGRGIGACGGLVGDASRHHAFESIAAGPQRRAKLALGLRPALIGRPSYEDEQDREVAGPRCSAPPSAGACRCAGPTGADCRVRLVECGFVRTIRMLVSARPYRATLSFSLLFYFQGVKSSGLVDAYVYRTLKGSCPPLAPLAESARDRRRIRPAVSGVSPSRRAIRHGSCACPGRPACRDGGRVPPTRCRSLSDGGKPECQRQLGRVEDRARRMSASCTGCIGRARAPPARNPRWPQQGQREAIQPGSRTSAARHCSSVDRRPPETPRAQTTHARCNLEPHNRDPLIRNN